MNEQSAKKIIGESAGDLYNIVTGGVADYLKEYGKQAHKHHSRTRSCLIHDHMVSRAKEAAAKLPAFKFISRAPRNFFDLGQKLLVQFKKLDRKLLTKNKETQLSLALEENPKALTLPGIPPRLPLITIGYVASHDHATIDGVFITYMENRKLKFHIPLTAKDNSTQLPQTNEQTAPSRKRVYAKGRRQQSGNDAVAI